jgi:hypothetical protein
MERERRELMIQRLVAACLLEEGSCTITIQDTGARTGSMVKAVTSGAGVPVEAGCMGDKVMAIY